MRSASADSHFGNPDVLDPEFIFFGQQSISVMTGNSLPGIVGMRDLIFPIHQLISFLRTVDLRHYIHGKEFFSNQFGIQLTRGRNFQHFKTVRSN